MDRLSAARTLRRRRSTCPTHRPRPTPGSVPWRLEAVSAKKCGSEDPCFSDVPQCALCTLRLLLTFGFWSTSGYVGYVVRSPCRESTIAGPSGGASLRAIATLPIRLNQTNRTGNPLAPNMTVAVCSSVAHVLCPVKYRASSEAIAHDTTAGNSILGESLNSTRMTAFAAKRFDFG
jgi:hypothetical protein